MIQENTIYQILTCRADQWKGYYSHCKKDLSKSPFAQSSLNEVKKLIYTKDFGYKVTIISSKEPRDAYPCQLTNLCVMH